MLKIYNKMKVLPLLAGLLFSVMISSPAWSDITHTVKKGDSLYKISKKYKIGIEEIRKANDLKTKKLTPGKELIIPLVESQNADSTAVTAENTPAGNAKNIPTAVNTAQPQVKTEPKTYKVKKGDTLWTIAKGHSISIAEIKKLNHRKSSRLKPGQLLVVGQEQVVAEAATVIPQIKMSGPNSKITEEIRELAGAPESELSGTKEFLISVAQKTLGIPYKFGASSFKATDCSGYVKMVFNLVGIDLPRSAREQFKVGQSVDREDLSIGDLVFFQTYAPFPSHVGIYLGNNLFVHASSFAKKVTIDSLSVPYYFKRFIGAKRFDGLMNETQPIPQDN